MATETSGTPAKKTAKRSTSGAEEACSEVEQRDPKLQRRERLVQAQPGCATGRGAPAHTSEQDRRRGEEGAGGS